MVYLSPSAIASKNIFQNASLNQLKKKSKKILKSKLLSTSLCIHRDLACHTKKLPEIVIHEHKPIVHQQIFKKTKTLPFIKPAELELVPKLEKSVIIKGISPPASIKMKRQMCIPNINVRLRNLIHPMPDADGVTIELTLCEDLKPASKEKQGLGVTLLYPPLISPSRSSFSISSKSSSKRGITTISRSTSISEVKDANEDVFYYGNIMRHVNMSSFYIILEGIADPQPNPFPYYSKVLKNCSKLMPVLKPLRSKPPKSYVDCNCKKYEESEKKTNKKAVILPSLKECRRNLPNLTCTLHSPQPVKYQHHLIIVNFEGALGGYTNSLCIKPGILKVIKKLSPFFQIILILALSPSKTADFLKIIENLEIPISGIYHRKEIDTSKELRKLQDYSLVYQDFKITDPEREVIIIASHGYLDEVGSNHNVLISRKVGISLKLHVERAPVACIEYPNSPCTVLLPNFQIKKNTLILKKLSKLAVFFREMEVSESFLNFRHALETSKFTILYNTDIHRVVFNQLHINPEGIHKVLNPDKQKYRKYGVYCYLHEKYSLPDYYAPFPSVFIIN